MSKDKMLKCKCNEIWNNIKNLPISVYALPPTTIESQLSPRLGIAGDCLYVKPKSGAVLPALEEVLGRAYEISTVENGWLSIKEAPVKLNLE